MANDELVDKIFYTRYDAWRYCDVYLKHCSIKTIHRVESVKFVSETQCKYQGYSGIEDEVKGFESHSEFRRMKREHARRLLRDYGEAD
jgi:hypothetical protein